MLNSASSIRSAAQGVLGGYNGDSLALQVIIGLGTGLTVYNAIELVVLILITFSRYRGLYFWSLLISSLGLIPYALGFDFKFFEVLTGDARWFSVALLSIGWYPMVTGQSVVLWSRLHLIVSGERGRKILIWTKWMIIVDAIVLHIPTSVVTFGSNGTIDTSKFVEAYNVIEKTQMTGFLYVVHFSFGQDELMRKSVSKRSFSRQFILWKPYTSLGPRYNIRRVV